MKSKFILGLILIFSLPACAEVTYNNHYHHNHNRPYNSPWVRNYNPIFERSLRNGVLTGFSPPVTPYYNNGIYTYNDGIVQKTYTTTGNRFQGIKNWFNRFNTNPYYSLNSLPYNPYVNGNYNTNQNSKAIQLFESGKPVNAYSDPYGNDVSGGVNSGCSVTIID